LAVISVLEGKSVEEIKNEWEKHIGKYVLKDINDYNKSVKGSGANLKPMIMLLKELGYSVERHNGGKAKNLRGLCAMSMVENKPIIARIQWLKDDGSEYYWKQAPLYTHYVLIRQKNIFCNGQGWFIRGSKQEEDYLKLGYVSSYLMVSK
jgi:hypothetical protein